MGLFSKRPDPSDTTDEAPIKNMIPAASTIPTPPPRPDARGQVRVTAADPNGAPSQSIERRAPAGHEPNTLIPTAPVTSGPPPLLANGHTMMSPPPPNMQGTQSNPIPLPPSAVVNVPPLPVAPKFGIDDAIKLLREMPGRDTPQVRDAVQRTLEFMHIDLDRLVEDAMAKDNVLENRAIGLHREVEQHEALALAARKQIAAIESERAELEATKHWMLEHRGPPSEPIPLDRVVRGQPHQS